MQWSKMFMNTIQDYDWVEDARVKLALKKDVLSKLVEEVVFEAEGFEGNLFLACSDDQTILTNFTFLGLYSNMIRDLGQELRNQTDVRIYLPFDHQDVVNTLTFLKTGGLLVDNVALLYAIIDICHSLGISVQNTQIEELSRRKKKIRKNLTLKTKVKDDIKQERIGDVEEINELKHHCQECSKSFKQLCQLKAHMVVHTGEKNFKCDDCGRRFGTRAILFNHRGVHNPIICDIAGCGRKFSQRNLYSTHLTKVHGSN